MAAYGQKRGMDLFEDRMRREGRFEEYTQACKRKRIDEGLTYMPGKWSVLRDWGYVDVATEEALLMAWEREIGLGRLEVADHEDQKARAQVELRKDFERAFSALPDTAPTQDEIDWVRSHPAMTRKARDPDIPCVEITAEDIATAPSKSAVIMLQNWANNPNEFLKRLLDEHKKATTVEEKPSVVREEDDLQDTEELLRSL